MWYFLVALVLFVIAFSILKWYSATIEFISSEDQYEAIMWFAGLSAIWPVSLILGGIAAIIFAFVWGIQFLAKLDFSDKEGEE